MITETEYYAKFVFSKELPESLKRVFIADFYNLYNKAVEELNKHYEEWNNEFDSLSSFKGVSENDPLKDYGGSEYCKFIARKQQKILDVVNNEGMHVLELKTSINDGDVLYGKCKLELAGLKDVTINIYFVDDISKI